MKRHVIFVILGATCDIACDSSSQCTEDASTGPACTLTSGLCNETTLCDDSLECSGIDPRTSCYSSIDQAPQCRPKTFNRLALQDGFHVGGMQISFNTMQAPTVLWQIPHDVEVVSCALFLCNPTFARLGCSTKGDSDFNTIANFEQCVLLFRTAPADQGSFALINENISREPSLCGNPRPSRHTVTKLAVGCWAYSTTTVVAASELVPVSGSLLPDLDHIPHAARCAADGDDCYDATVDLFGVCSGGACRARCWTSADCSLATRPQETDTECRWSCRSVPRSTLGACVPN